MFGLFRKKVPAASEKYYVYKTKIEKYRQLISELQRLLSENKKVALVCFDRTAKGEVEKLLNAVSLNYLEDQSSLGNESRVLLYSFEYLIHHPVNSDIPVLAVDIPTYRSKSLQLARELKDHDFITFFTSLDNTVFALFGAERIAYLMDSLGMKENERIDHTMVTRAIINAQEKLEKKERG